MHVLSSFRQVLEMICNQSLLNQAKCFKKPQHIIHMLYHNIYGRTPSLAVEEQNTFYLTKSVLILFNNVDCWYKKRNVCDHLQFCNIQKMLQETSDIASGF